MWWILLLAGQSVAMAQDAPEPRLITVQLTRTMPQTPDVGVIGVGVSSVLPIGLDEAVALVKAAGFTAADLTDGGFGSSARLSYVFQRQVPAAQTRDWLQRIQALPHAPGASIVTYLDWEYSNMLLARLREGVLSGVIAEARREAQAVATASGLRMRELVAVREGGTVGFAVGRLSPPSVPTPGAIIPLSALLVSLKPAPQVTYSLDFLVE